MTPNEQFLAAWESAGKPPVKRLVYPRFGQGRDKVLFSHSEIQANADTSDATFTDNGEDVKLSWCYSTESFEDGGGNTELYFDRANPIQVGRTATA